MDLYVTLVVVLALSIGSQGTFLPHIGITNGGLGLHPGHLPGAMNIGGGGDAGGGTLINGGVNAGGSMNFNGGGSAVANGGYQTHIQGQGISAVNVGGGGSGNSVINGGGASTVNGGSSQVYESRVINGGSQSHVQGGGNVNGVNVGVVNGPPKPCA